MSYNICGIDCKGTSGFLWGIFGRSGCVEKLWQKKDGTCQIFLTKEEAEKELNRIRREELDNCPFGRVGEIAVIAVDKIYYPQRDNVE